MVGAEALVVRAKAMARASEAKVGKLRRRLPGRRPRNQGKPPLGGITGPWADDGSSMMAQQAKAVEEEDAQTALGGLY